MIIYTDGACFPNPGKGGWGWTDLNGWERCGGESPSTNQKMEMMAVIDALAACLEKGIHQVTIVSDSQYVINGATTWRKKWEGNGWKNSRGETVKNLELWKQLHSLADLVGVVFTWVKGHSGNPGNERADQLSTKGTGCTEAEIDEAQRRFRILKGMNGKD